LFSIFAATLHIWRPSHPSALPQRLVSVEAESEYSGRKITASFSYVTERGEGKKERARGSKTAKRMSMKSATENIFFPFNFDTVGGILIH
jgi:hypothetical protein